MITTSILAETKCRAPQAAGCDVGVAGCCLVRPFIAVLADPHALSFEHLAPRLRTTQILPIDEDTVLGADATVSVPNAVRISFARIRINVALGANGNAGFEAPLAVFVSNTH